jgi:hypothetical protein
MKLPSFSQILQTGRKTFLRFPLVLLSAIGATVSAIVLIDHEGPASATILFNLLFGSILGIPLLLAIALTTERRGWSSIGSYIAQSAGIVLLILYALTVPSALGSAPIYHVQRLMLLGVGALCLLSVGPFLGLDGQQSFWQYNKTLVFRFLGAALYSTILYIGLSLALVAVDQLFGLEIPGRRYGQLWFFIAGILNTWLFLAGIPERFDVFEQSVEYPKSLRLLVQYVLVPLAVVYAIIIYAYIGKILISWQWPDGMISPMILGFAVTGFFSLALVYPLHEREAVGWMSAIARWFPYTMIPLVALFPFAIWRRVSEYGITEARYVALVLAAWLFVTVGYFVFVRERNFRYFPTTIGVLAVLVSYGPWNMFEVSARSQVERLKELLVQNSILVGGAIQKAPRSVSRESAKNVSSILDYLHLVHGYDRIQAWFPTSLRADTRDQILATKAPEVVADLMGVPYVHLRPASPGSVVSFGIDQNSSVAVKGYDRLVRLQFVNRGGVKKEYVPDSVSIELSNNLDSLTIRTHASGILLIFDLRPTASELLTEYANEGVGNVPPEKLTLTAATAGLRATVFLRSLQARRRGEGIEISNVSADVAFAVE